jgi:hypothetical protein
MPRPRAEPPRGCRAPRPRAGRSCNPPDAPAGRGFPDRRWPRPSAAAAWLSPGRSTPAGIRVIMMWKACRRPLGQQPVLVAEVDQEPAGIAGVAGIQRGEDDGRRLPALERQIVVPGHRTLHHRAQQVPLVAPVGVQRLHGDVGPLGDADHRGRRVAPLGEFGPRRGEQPPAGLAPRRLARFPLPARLLANLRTARLNSPLVSHSPPASPVSSSPGRQPSGNDINGAWVHFFWSELLVLVLG